METDKGQDHPIREPPIHRRGNEVNSDLPESLPRRQNTAPAGS
jgi:hypothetical protein